ncbi:hypothetical protein FRZ67_02615 [Panacibacter ginsenosidivorans]|uniref:Uncharacterized protein n=1 Tax=Panacibacter ginsenosidivorans TaxID=1813871 RepID=A0A5B8V685_9BACT|nr:hypothetical protein [Panacibacter ginsenosidivorans]QEC66251.1 hypothetical protein FRZ67_02615 [Panacibacter ginsenosidivorans]
MKPQFIVRLFGSLLFSIIFLGLYAQEIKELPPVTVTTSSKVTEKVARAFDKSFKDAIRPEWYKLNKNYFVKFISEDQKNNALFTKSGNLIYHISYGYEKNLPDDIRKMVKSTYVDFNITTAIKVEEQGRKIWVINLEDDKHLVLIRIEDDQLEEVGNYNKS